MKKESFYKLVLKARSFKRHISLYSDATDNKISESHFGPYNGPCRKLCFLFPKNFRGTKNLERPKTLSPAHSVSSVLKWEVK